jgi:hypothetical protein
MTFTVDLRSKLLNAIQFIENKKHVFVHHPKLVASKSFAQLVITHFTYL